jgi:hypothetical protein
MGEIFIEPHHLQGLLFHNKTNGNLKSFQYHTYIYNIVDLIFINIYK